MFENIGKHLALESIPTFWHSAKFPSFYINESSISAWKHSSLSHIYLQSQLFSAIEETEQAADWLKRGSFI